MVKLIGLLGCYGMALIGAWRQTSQPARPPDSRPLMCTTLGFPLQTQQPLLVRLKPADRARVLAALAGLTILGFVLVLLTWWGGRFTRRYLKRPWPGSQGRDAGGVSEFDWASKPLYGDEDDQPHDREEPRE